MIRLWKSFANEISEMWRAESYTDFSDILYARAMAFLIVFLVCICIGLAGAFLWTLVTNPTVLLCVLGIIAIPSIVIKCLLNTAKKENEKEKHILVVAKKEDRLP